MTEPTASPLILREVHNHNASHPEYRLRVYAVGERGPNGDNHLYLINGQKFSMPVQDENGVIRARLSSLPIKFQEGDPSQGYNGVTIESLLAVAYDRLNGCQAGPFASEHNAQAMIAISKALEHLHDRSRERLAAQENASE